MDLDDYLKSLVAAYPRGDLRDRQFREPEKWGEWSNQNYRSRPLLDADPNLDAVLAERFAIVLGEPGSGKSSVVHLAIERAIQKQWTPIVGILKGFDGDIAKVFAPQPPGRDGQRLYILDGLDEVHEGRLADAVRAITGLIDATPSNRVLLTSRQAFYANRADLFPGQKPVAYHLLSLTSDDIDALVYRAGVDRTAFLKAADQARVYGELYNPFALLSLLSLYKDTGSLTESRSGAVRHVVDRLLADRPTADARNQRRALRMLAVAMEAAARNQLTEAEGIKTLVTAMKMDEAQAARLLNELTLSILVRTNDGYSFQMASHGEYLAAEDLQDIQDRTRFLPLMRLPDRTTLSDSWQNAASYLAELHRGFRSWLVRNKPEWAITASPACFSEEEKTKVVAAITSELATEQIYLANHPTISVERLSVFVTEPSREMLTEQLNSAHTIVAANALLLLGAAKDGDIADKAFAIALDEKQDMHLRRSALSALEYVGRPTMVPALLRIDNWDDGLTAARLDAAGSLIEPTQLLMLLEALARTETMILGAHRHLNAFESDDVVVATLDAMEAIQPDRLSFRLSSYLDTLWKLMIRRWRPEWAARVAKIVLGSGHEHEYGSAIEELIKLLESDAAVANHVGAAIVDELHAKPRPVSKFNHHAIRLVGEADARRVRELNDKDLIASIRAFGSRPARLFLHHADPVEYVPSPQEIAWQREDDARQEVLAKNQETAVDDSLDPKERLNALWRIHDSAKWPTMSSENVKHLTAKVEEELYALNLRKSIRWESESSWSRPQSLSFFLEVIEKYGMVLVDDHVLALAIMASQQHEVGKYFKRNGFSAKAIDTLEDLLRDTSVADGAKDSILRFISASAISTASLIDAVEQITMSASSLALKSASVSALISMPEAISALKRVRPAVPADLVETIDVALIEKADRPTIERRLTQLLDHPETLADGETEHPWDNKLGWIGKIAGVEYWEKLKRLRRQALQDRRGRVSWMLTSALRNIDAMKSADLLEEQLPDTPVDWRPYVRTNAVEIRRDASIKAAQNAPFEDVLARLRRATTIRLFKIVCEGPRDMPAFEEFAAKLPNDVGGDIKVQSVGGWANVLPPEWNPMALTDGSHDQLVIMDGDRGRDFANPNKPLRPDAKKVLEKIATADIECVVLERYALENYFPEHAFVSVIGPEVKKYFPLDPNRAIEDQIREYKKNMNGPLASATALADLAGTDLGRALADIADRAGL